MGYQSNLIADHCIMSWDKLAFDIRQIVMDSIVLIN